MVLVIDTSSARSALALIEDGRPVAEDVVAASREPDLPRRLEALRSSRRSIRPPLRSWESS